MDGLQALNEFLVGRRIDELDIYLDVSAASVLEFPLAAETSPDGMIRILVRQTSRE